MPNNKGGWRLKGQLPTAVWEKAKAKYLKEKVSDKKIKAQYEYKGLNKFGEEVHIRYTIDNGGNKNMRPELSSKAVLKELSRAKRPKPKLSDGEKLFMKDRVDAVQEYNAANGFNFNDPRAAELDHIYGSGTPQHPAFIAPRERLVNQMKGGQAADAGFPIVDLSQRPNVKISNGAARIAFKSAKVAVPAAAGGLALSGLGAVAAEEQYKQDPSFINDVQRKLAQTELAADTVAVGATAAAVPTAGASLPVAVGAEAVSMVAGVTNLAIDGGKAYMKMLMNPKEVSEKDLDFSI
jgi:hypothetical protein